MLGASSVARAFDAPLRFGQQAHFEARGALARSVRFRNALNHLAPDGRPCDATGMLVSAERGQGQVVLHAEFGEDRVALAVSRYQRDALLLCASGGHPPQVTSADGRVLPAAIAAYDHASGFALLRLLTAGSGKPLKLGDSTALAERDPAMVVTAPARDSPSLVYVASRRPFSGSWEYLLDSAIYTYPPVEEWSGAPLISSKGELLGIGSLVVRDAAAPGAQTPGNMFVPIDLVKPILEDLIAGGRRKGPSRPWLGINADEVHGHLFVSRVSPEGPADRAGVRGGDIVIAVGADAVTTLADFYRKVWARGEAGAEVPLRVLQGAQLRDITVRSVDRASYFRPALTY